MKIMQNSERSGTGVRTFFFSLTYYVIFEEIYFHLGVSVSLFLKNREVHLNDHNDYIFSPEFYDARVL